MPTHYYVWYKVAGGVREARAAVAGMMSEVAQATGINGRLLARRDDTHTWMEIYVAVADAGQFERALTDAGKRYGVAHFAKGGARHLEAFIAVD